jgi:hypothetical protein
MSFETLAAWFVGVFAFILLDLIVMMLARSAREAKRLQTRVGALADGPPGIDPAKVAATLERLQVAAEHIAPLVARMEAALAIIRRGPTFLPVELPPIFVIIQRDIAWLRGLAR